MTIRDAIKKFIGKLIYKEKYDSETYIKYLKSVGVKIGEGTTIYHLRTVYFDSVYPWLIKIGKDVKITKGTTMLTHGFDWCVLKKIYGEVLGSAGPIEIGDNVFIGMNTTILKNTKIGNNVIIGANSLVNKNIPDNYVAVGNPAKVLMSIEEYYKKRKNAQYDEASNLVNCFRNNFNKEADEQILHEFFYLFQKDTENIHPIFDKHLHIGSNYEYSKNILRKNATYENIEEFLKSIN